MKTRGHRCNHWENFHARLICYYICLYKSISVCFLDCDKWRFIACCIENAKYICSSAIFGKFDVISVAKYREFYDIRATIISGFWVLFKLSFFCHHNKLPRLLNFLKKTYNVVFILRKICMNVYKKAQLLFSYM